ncbi:MAG: MgtC/SapB family protein [Gemmatimonadales bacterium]
MPTDALTLATRLGIAALAGLAVGFEREWSGHASGPAARFAGIRTFMLLGLLGGIGGWCAVEGREAIGALLLAAGAGLSLVAYLAAVRRNPADLDGTTEVAAIVVLALGAVAGAGQLAIAGGGAAVVALMLGEKQVIRDFVSRIDEAEMRAGLQFAVLALVILPLLPEGPFGPWDAIRPRLIWTVVVLLSGVNFASFLARQALGESRGHLAAGALGGLISSTAVTLAYARKSRLEPEHTATLAAGSIVASTVLFPRVALVATALNPAFAPTVAVWLGAMFVVAVGAALFVASKTRRLADGTAEEAAPANPLQLGSAVKMALGFQLVMLFLEAARDRFGDLGIFTGAALAGLTDVDALTLGMSRMAGDGASAHLAAAALLVGIISNTVLKAAVALVVGGKDYRRKTAPALLLVAAAGAASWYLLAARFRW